MQTNSLIVFHGDRRQDYLADYLLSKGYPATRLKIPAYTGNSESSSLENYFSNASHLIGPISFGIEDTKIVKIMKPGQTLIGGNIPEDIVLFCKKKGIISYDYIKSELLAQENAAITAECLVGKIILDIPTTLFGINCLILGYGRCGSRVAHYLQGFHSKIFILDCDLLKLNSAENCGYNPVLFSELTPLLPTLSLLINTIPKSILSKQLLSMLHKDCNLFELASTPGGFAENEITELSLSLHSCPGLPGKSAPKTAGFAIGREVCRYLERIERNEL